jgi:hypothetical protein
MHHYSTTTYCTLTDKAPLHPIWQLAIPKHALLHPFLMHGLLALAALHLCQDFSPPERSLYTELASTHQNQALTVYITQLQSITEGNCHALFAFSSILAALSYAFLQTPLIGVVGDAYVENIVEVFDLLVGATAIAVEAREWLKQGNLSQMLTPARSVLDHDASLLSDDLRKAFEALLERANHLPSSQDQYDGLQESNSSAYIRKDSLYASSIRRMIVTFSLQDCRAPELSDVIGWPVFLDPSYISLLKKRDSMALVILAYYGAGLHAFNDVWWLRGLGARLVRAVSDIVDDSWHPYLRWAIDRTSIHKGI